MKIPKRSYPKNPYFGVTKSVKESSTKSGEINLVKHQKKQQELLTTSSSCSLSTIQQNIETKHESLDNININNNKENIEKKQESSFCNVNVTRLIRLLLDAKRVGGLIGKGGVAITKIRTESQAKILIAKPIPHSLFRICSIEGEYMEIVSAICLVIDKMAEESTRLPPYQITILVEEKNIGCLIGKKGNAITEIRTNTNANIYISSHLLRNSSEKTVDICGERNAVHQAIKMVIKRLCNNPSYATTRMLYDPQMDFIPQTQANIIANNALSKIKNTLNTMNTNNNNNNKRRNNNDNNNNQNQKNNLFAAQQQHLNNNNNNKTILGGTIPTTAATTFYTQQVAQNNGRLLNYALNRFGTISTATVQPQIIGANTRNGATSTTKLISPLATNRLATAASALLTPSLLANSLNTTSTSPFSPNHHRYNNSLCPSFYFSIFVYIFHHSFKIKDSSFSLSIFFVSDITTSTTPSLHSMKENPSLSTYLSQRSNNNNFTNNSFLSPQSAVKLNALTSQQDNKLSSPSGIPALDGTNNNNNNNNNNHLRNNNNHRNNHRNNNHRNNNNKNNNNNNNVACPPNTNSPPYANNNCANNHHNRNNGNSRRKFSPSTVAATTQQQQPLHYPPFYTPRLIGTPLSPISPPRPNGQTSPITHAHNTHNTHNNHQQPPQNLNTIFPSTPKRGQSHHNHNPHHNHNNNNNNNNNNHNTSQLNQQTSVTFPVASHLIGGVIGRGGRNIQEIRRQTNAEIKIDNEGQNGQTNERYIRINGTPQQISTAVYMISNSLSTHSYS